MEQEVQLFNDNGNLMPGIHEMAWANFKKLFGTNAHRCRLLKGLERAIRQLKRAGCEVMYIDGSFVTRKGLPNDYDACWEVNGVDPKLLDPVLIHFSDRTPMKIKYRGDLFPAHMGERGSGKTFLDFFQIDKASGDPKGIVKLNIKEIK